MVDKESIFLDVIGKNKQIIYKVCYMYAVDEDHLKDLYQEILINLWQGLDRFRGDAQISTWIYRMSINTCITQYRRNKQNVEMLPLEMLLNLPSEDDNRMESIKQMYQLINRLNRMEKAIILMWLDEKTYDEIAEVTGLSRNNVASRLRRIKAKLVEYGKE